jgi:drug/metabolite transporter (DMT)-like permease
LSVLACTAIASVAFNWGISRVPGVRASQLLNLTPVVGLVAAVVFLAERPSVAQYLGGGLVLVAVVLLVRVVEHEDGAGLVVVAEPGDDSALVAERPEPDRAA